MVSYCSHSNEFHVAIEILKLSDKIFQNFTLLPWMKQFLVHYCATPRDDRNAHQDRKETFFNYTYSFDKLNSRSPHFFYSHFIFLICMTSHKKMRNGIPYLIIWKKGSQMWHEIQSRSMQNLIHSWCDKMLIILLHYVHKYPADEMEKLKILFLNPQPSSTLCFNDNEAEYFFFHHIYVTYSWDDRIQGIRKWKGAEEKE